MNGEPTALCLDWLLIWLANLLLQVTCVIALAIPVAKLFARRAVLAHGVLVTALALTLVSPLSTIWLQRSGLQHFRLPAIEVPIENESSVAREWPDLMARESQLGSAQTREQLSNFSNPALEGTFGTKDRLPKDDSEMANQGMRQLFVSRSRLIVWVVGGIWLAGAALMATRWARGWGKLLGIIRMSRPVQNPAANALFASLSKAAGMIHPPRFLESSVLAGPIAVGYRGSSAVILPQKLLTSIDTPELAPLLTHELAHLTRRDQWELCFQQGAVVCFWFHPLVHTLNSLLSRSREEICDNHVLAQTGAAGYSRSLLRIAEIITPATASALSLEFMSVTWTLETRISGILDERRNTMTRCSRFDLLAIGLVAFVISFFATVAMVGRAAAKTAPAVVQNDEVGPCVLAFAARPMDLLQSDISKSLGVLNRARFDPQFDLYSAAETVRGVISLPEDFDELLPTASSRPPFEFYIEFKLSKEIRDSRYHEYLAERGVRVDSTGDVESFRLGGEDGHVVVFDKKTVTILSNAFEYNPKKLPAMTDIARKQLEQNDRADGVIVFDCDAARRLIESGVKFAQENSRDKLVERLDSLAEIDWVTAALQMDNIATVTIETECNSNDSAAQVGELVEDLVALAESQIPQNVPSAKIFNKVLDSVRTRVAGKRVHTSLEFDQAAAEETRQSNADALIVNNHRQAALGIHNYLDANQSLPFQPPAGQSEQLSWRVRVLPMLDAQELYDRFDLNAPWDSPANAKLIEEMPRIFGENGKTNLCWVKSDITHLSDISRGTSNTIAFVHSDKFVNWTENNDVTPDEVLKQFRSLRRGEFLIATFYDGSVRKISAESDWKELESMLYPTDGD